MWNMREAMRNPRKNASINIPGEMFQSSRRETEQWVLIEHVALDQHLHAKRQSDKTSFINEVCEKRSRAHEKGNSSRLRFPWSLDFLTNRKIWLHSVYMTTYYFFSLFFFLKHVFKVNRCVSNRKRWGNATRTVHLKRHEQQQPSSHQYVRLRKTYNI